MRPTNRLRRERRVPAALHPIAAGGRPGRRSTDEVTPR